MAKARFTTTRSISYDDDFDLEPCLALLRGDAIEEDEELESNPRVATASVVDDDDADEYDDDEPFDDDAEYEDDEYEDDE